MAGYYKMYDGNAGGRECGETPGGRGSRQFEHPTTPGGRPAAAYSQIHIHFYLCHIKVYNILYIVTRQAGDGGRK